MRSRTDEGRMIWFSAVAALQNSLLPTALPVIRGVKIAARYVPGDGRVGGDW